MDMTGVFEKNPLETAISTIDSGILRDYSIHKFMSASLLFTIVHISKQDVFSVC